MTRFNTAMAAFIVRSNRRWRPNPFALLGSDWI